MNSPFPRPKCPSMSVRFRHTARSNAGHPTGSTVGSRDLVGGRRADRGSARVAERRAVAGACRSGVNPHRRAQALASRPPPRPRAAPPRPAPSSPTSRDGKWLVWHAESAWIPAICHLSASRLSRTLRCPGFSSSSSQWPRGSRACQQPLALLSRCPPRLFRCPTPAAGADSNNRGGVELTGLAAPADRVTLRGYGRRRHGPRHTEGRKRP